MDGIAFEHVHIGQTTGNGQTAAATPRSRA